MHRARLRQSWARTPELPGFKASSEHHTVPLPAAAAGAAGADWDTLLKGPCGICPAPQDSFTYMDFWKSQNCEDSQGS